MSIYRSLHKNIRPRCYPHKRQHLFDSCSCPRFAFGPFSLSLARQDSSLLWHWTLIMLGNLKYIWSQAIFKIRQVFSSREQSMRATSIRQNHGPYNREVLLIFLAQRFSCCGWGVFSCVRWVCALLISRASAAAYSSVVLRLCRMYTKEWENYECRMADRDVSAQAILVEIYLSG